VVSHISATDVNSLDSAVDRETLKDWRTMTNAVSTVKHYTRGLSLRIETQHSLGLEIETGRLEFLEEQFSGLLSVGEGVQRGFGEEDWVLLGRGLKEIKYVAPYQLHVIDVHDDSMLHRVTKLQCAFVFFLKLHPLLQDISYHILSDIGILAVSGDHDLLVLGASNTRLF